MFGWRGEKKAEQRGSKKGKLGREDETQRGKGRSMGGGGNRRGMNLGILDLTFLRGENPVEWLLLFLCFLSTLGRIYSPHAPQRPKLPALIDQKAALGQSVFFLGNLISVLCLLLFLCF